MCHIQGSQQLPPYPNASFLDFHGLYQHILGVDCKTCGVNAKNALELLQDNGGQYMLLKPERYVKKTQISNPVFFQGRGISHIVIVSSHAKIREERDASEELVAATRSFNATYRLGKEGFGVVYRGILRNGKEVVVKTLDISSLQGEREFQNELSIIDGLQSPFLVSLLGYCADGKRRLLVLLKIEIWKAMWNHLNGDKLHWDPPSCGFVYESAEGALVSRARYSCSGTCSERCNGDAKCAFLASENCIFWLHVWGL
eukprot:Gb_00855 [translate_table: standard]